MVREFVAVEDLDRTLIGPRPPQSTFNHVSSARQSSPGNSVNCEFKRQRWGGERVQEVALSISTASPPQSASQKENTMRLSNRTLVAGLASLATLVLPSVSSATDARTAIRLCDRNPACNYTVSDNGDVSLSVGGNLIECPQEGECICICTQIQAGGTGGRPTLEGLLRDRVVTSTTLGR
jgi:hypothetical protein